MVWRCCLYVIAADEGGCGVCGVAVGAFGVDVGACEVGAGAGGSVGPLVRFR